MTTYEDRQRQKEIAARVADKLWDDMKAGTIKSINIDIVNLYLKDDIGPKASRHDFHILQEMTLRNVIGRVG